MNDIFYQLAIIFEKPFSHRYDRLSVEIQNRYIDSKSVQMLPLPDDAPEEIPRLVIEWKDLRAEVNKLRINIVGKNFDEITRMYPPLIDLLYTSFATNIARVGFVKHYFIPEEVPDAEKILKPGLISAKNQGEHVVEMSLSITTRFEYMDFEINNVQAIQPGEVTVDDKTSIGLIVIRDINTKREEGYKFDKQWIKDFYPFANKTADQMIIDIGSI